ncbi:membrane associated [Moniliophthora roreri MCA 2997]|uniref:Membrane associated n=1 Tax=Moniliophthora roreri (strain MCA 2997) TaxID=1381753 RepID=V2XDH6_MONRO|nr:membrane associated [Moniliophthora roreri MCA 2997]
MSGILKNFIGWSIVPDFVTKNGLFMFHQYVFPRFGFKVPPTNSPTYREHYRYAYAIVVLGYLFYTLVDGARAMEYNFYEILGVPPDVDENGLKIAFRNFARKYHPDRPGVGNAGAELFMRVRDAFEALKNPTVRFAYDRFGPDVLQWTKLSTTREYMRHGLLQSSGYHIFSGISLAVISSIGRPSPVSFWRFILFFSFLALELAFILYPTPSPSTSATIFTDPAAGLSFKTIFYSTFPYRVPYQHIRFLHQVFMFLSIALTRVAPRLFPDDPRTEYQIVLQHLEAMAGFADREASMMLHTELHSIHPFTPETRVPTTEMQPCNPSADVMDTLAKELENMIIETNLKKGIGPLRTAREKAVERGRGAKELNATRKPLSATLLNTELEARANGNLPSPRPSPPPPPGLQRRGSSFVRARSVSY